jgi:hypothetical protein
MKDLINFIGKTKFLEDNIIKSEDIFSINLTNSIESKLTREEYITTYYIVGEYVKALGFTREKKISLSKFYYDYTDEIFKTKIKNDFIKKFISVTSLPSKAYYQYKVKNFDEAINLTIQSINIDHFLENEYDINILHMHKVQQVHNLARIFYGRNMYVEWADYIKQMLNYLINMKKPSYLKENWKSSSIEQSDIVLRKRMIMQLLNETIYFCSVNQNSQQFNFNKFISHILNIENTEFNLFKQLKMWGEIKKLLYSRDNSSNLENQIIHFFKQKNDYVPLSRLKLSIINDLKDCIAYEYKDQFLSCLDKNSGIPNSISNNSSKTKSFGKI